VFDLEANGRRLEDIMEATLEANQRRFEADQRKEARLALLNYDCQLRAASLQTTEGVRSANDLAARLAAAALGKEAPPEQAYGNDDGKGGFRQAQGAGYTNDNRFKHRPVEL